MRFPFWLDFLKPKRRPLPKPGKLQCAACHAPIHRFDRYEVLQVQHKDCRDPKLVGQKSLPREKQTASTEPTLPIEEIQP